jgi:hypothetical protein
VIRNFPGVYFRYITVNILVSKIGSVGFDRMFIDFAREHAIDAFFSKSLFESKSNTANSGE